MAALTICIITIFIIILLLVQKVSIRFVLSDSWFIFIDYFFFSMILKKSDTSGKKKKRKKRSYTSGSIVRMLLRIVRSSHITVNEFKIPISVADPSRSAIASGAISSGIYPVINLIVALADKADIEENAFLHNVNGDGRDPYVDITLKTELYNICFSGILLLYEGFKRRIARSNVRKSNE